ncbi:MAG TPA: FAD-dependent oxidoreductase [Marinagarivorans sp.]
MKIAVIGSGISGLTAAHLLYRQHEVTVFEKNDRLGGHTATKSIHYGGKDYAIDTGFIVYNDWTYPNFIKLLERLNVTSQATTMGFSVSHPETGYEYSGENLNSLFCQRRNLLNVRHWRMIKDILRFNKQAVADYLAGRLSPDGTLGEYLIQHNYSAAFRDYYLLPMGAAIWSSSPGAMLDFPLLFFVRFCHNHGLLSVNDRPTWRVIQGGSANYIPRLIAGFEDQVRLSSRIEQVKRAADGVDILVDGQQEHYDAVIFACHSDEALALLADASVDERTLLEQIQYRKNSVVLHTDKRFLPKRKLAWSSWNYQLDTDLTRPPVLTYSMNILQGIKAPVEFCVTLNARDEIDSNKILGEYVYAHPVFTKNAIAAQEQWQSINGVNHTWFCGAYWFNGFHEDGVKSAVRVSDALGGETL